MKEQALYLFCFLIISSFIQFISMNITGILTTYETRIKQLFSKQSILRIIRYSAIYYLIVLLINKLNPNWIEPFGISRILFNYPIPTWDLVSILTYFILSIIFFSFFYFLRNNQIRKNLSHFSYKKVQNYRGYKEFLISSIIANVICILSLYLLFYIISNLNSWFTNNGMYILDWLDFDLTNNEDFKRGFYFSFLISAVFTIIYQNAIIKFSDNSYGNSSMFKFYLLSVVLFFTFLSGFYSITNSIFNLKSHSRIYDWYEADKQLGVFALRLASLILFFHIFSYISKNVMKSNIFQVILAGISPYHQADIKHTALSERLYSTTFIAQIGFYILNVSIAEFSLIFKDESFFRTLLNFALAFIVDDYIIIHSYSNELNKVLYWHNRRIDIFNAILFLGGCAMLISLGFTLLALAYAILSIILAQYYYKNQNKSIEV